MQENLKSNQDIIDCTSQTYSQTQKQQIKRKKEKKKIQEQKKKKIPFKKITKEGIKKSRFQRFKHTLIYKFYNMYFVLFQVQAGSTFCFAFEIGQCLQSQM